MSIPGRGPVGLPQGIEGGRVAPVARRPLSQIVKPSPIWLALAALGFISAIAMPASLQETSLAATVPFAVVTTVASLGQLLVIMTGGIDLSVSSVITMAGVILLKEAGGSDERLVYAIVVVLLVSSLFGLINGILVAKIRITPLIATLVSGALLTGLTIWYQGGLQKEAVVPRGLSEWAGQRVPGMGYFSYYLLVGVALVLVVAFVLAYTKAGRRFATVGANPRAAWISGVSTDRHQMAAYMLAAAFYGLSGILLSAFIRSPTLLLGGPYLLSTVVTVVLSGASLSGGVGSAVDVAGAALFITQLEQVLRLAGASTAVQNIFRGSVIIAAMALPALRTAVGSLRRVVRQGS